LPDHAAVRAARDLQGMIKRRSNSNSNCVLISVFFLIYLKTKLLRINLKVKHCEAP
jgi:hypothetical protein